MLVKENLRSHSTRILRIDKVSTLPELQTEYGQGNEGAYNPYSDLAGDRLSLTWRMILYMADNVQNEYTKGGLHNGQYYVPQRAAAGLDPWATPQAYNNAKDFFQTGVTWSNSVNVAQSFDKGNYSFSLGNTTSDGIVRSTGMDRYNVKLSVRHNCMITGRLVLTKLRDIKDQEARNR